MLLVNMIKHSITDMINYRLLKNGNMISHDDLDEDYHQIYETSLEQCMQRLWSKFFGAGN